MRLFGDLLEHYFSPIPASLREAPFSSKILAMKKHVQTSPTADDVARLIRGRASPSKVGSRGVPHRLRSHEIQKLKVAAQRGYLLMHKSTRPALVNAWTMWCQAHELPCLMKQRRLDGSHEEVGSR